MKTLPLLLIALLQACSAPSHSLTGPSAAVGVTNLEREAAPAMDGGPQATWTTPLVLGLSGQSNAGMIRPFLEAKATVVGNAAAGTGISCWADVVPQGNVYDGTCWAGLKPLLASRSDFDAFVWWQGDTELDHPQYTEPLADLIRRVRAETKNPRLLIVVLQLGAVNGDDPEGAGAQAFRWVQQDPHAVYIETRDKEYKADRQHMTDQGYRDVTERIIAAVKANTGR